jgi:hypothetical protein
MVVAGNSWLFQHRRCGSALLTSKKTIVGPLEAATGRPVFAHTSADARRRIRDYVERKWRSSPLNMGAFQGMSLGLLRNSAGGATRPSGTRRRSVNLPGRMLGFGANWSLPKKR